MRKLDPIFDGFELIRIHIGDPIKIRGDTQTIHRIFGVHATLHFAGAFIDGSGSQIIVFEIVTNTAKGEARRFNYNLGKPKPPAVCEFPDVLDISFVIAGFDDDNTILICDQPEAIAKVNELFGPQDYTFRNYSPNTKQ